MKDCWKVRPSDRPSFTQLRKYFDAMLSSNERASQYYMTLKLNTGISTDTYTTQQNENTLARSNLYVKVV